MIKVFVFLFLIMIMGTFSEPEFEGLEQGGQSNFKDLQKASSSGEDNPGFWKRLRTKFLKGSVENHFPSAEEPEQSDIMLHFDDRVVNSFSDHMVAEQVPMVYELSYHIHRSQLRISLLMDYDELASVSDLSGVVELEDAKVRKAEGDVPIVAVDAAFKIFSKKEEKNTVYLAFDKLKTYRFWRDGRESGTQSNIGQFKRYVKASVQGITRENVSQKLEELQKAVQASRDQGELKIAFEKQDELDALRKDTSFFSLVEDKFNSQIQLKPEFIGNLLAYLQQQDAFCGKLELSHYAVEPENPEQPTIQLIRVGRLDQAMNLNLPDLEIDYVRIQDRKMSFSGSLRP